MIWQKKLGYIVPASNAVVEFEVARMLPEGVSAHFTRAPHLPSRAERLKAMVESLPAMARDLSYSAIDSLCFACTTGSFSDPTFEPRALAAARSIPGLPVTTSATALVTALNTLGADRLTVVTPYPDDYNALLGQFLTRRGLRILRMASLYSEEAETISPEVTATFVRENFELASNGILVSCTKLRTLEVIADLERMLGVPVVSSISASHWHTMRLAGVTADFPAGGRLFEHQLAPASASEADATNRSKELHQSA